MKVTDPLISIVIPIYNVELYLDRCLKSIVNQTYDNLEIILVDDGSVDRCSNICDNWGKKDHRIKVIHKKNGGLSDARNSGTNIANGKYITYIDSDDWVSNYYVEMLYKTIYKTEADIAVCNFTKTNKEIQYKEKLCNPIVYNNLEAIKKMLYQKNIDNSAWGKLYPTNLMKKMLYPTGRLYEDLFITYKVFANVNKVAYLNSSLYYYWINPNGIMNSGFSEKIFDEIDAVDEIVDYVEKNIPDIKKAAYSRKFSSYSQVFRWIPNDIQDGTVKLKKDKLWEFIEAYRTCMIRDNNARLKNRIGAVVSYLGPRIYSQI
nr:glycosyltransferase family 2 protein [uncultured Agathobacter sp.]